MRSTTKNKREKKSYKTKNSEDDDDNKLLNDLVSPEKNYKKKKLRESLSKTGPLRLGSKNQFPLNFAREYILVQK